MSKPRDIEPTDIRKGDRVRVAWTPRLPHMIDAFEYVAPEDGCAMRKRLDKWGAADRRYVLLDRPAPAVPPGTTGTATVQGVPGVRVLRDGEGWWHTATENDWSDTSGQVTDFVPDVLWTEELSERLAGHVERGLRDVFEEPGAANPAARLVREFFRGGES